MIKHASIIVFTALLSGCHVLPWSTQRQEAVGPPLPMSVSCEDLVDHLNRQSGNLKSWRSTSVKLTADLPGTVPMPPMKGSIACESPNRFHLNARNFAARAELGANSERCWFMSSPGHDGVISWRHEDAHLLQDFPSQVPYIDPDWLMLVLGVKQLDSADYVLEPGDDPGTEELWLTSIQSAGNSDVYRYVIKVSTRQRVVREHAAYDQDHRLLVRARLSDHQWFDGHLLPRRVQIELPSTGAVLKLSFARIETDVPIDSAMWVVPSIPGGDNIDLAEFVKSSRIQPTQYHWNDEPQARPLKLSTPQFEQDNGEFQTVESTISRSRDLTPTEPDWSTSPDAVSPFGQDSRHAPRRRRFLGVFPALW